jgi:hypothetical protein
LAPEKPDPGRISIYGKKLDMTGAVKMSIEKPAQQGGNSTPKPQQAGQSSGPVVQPPALPVFRDWASI